MILILYSANMVCNETDIAHSSSE